jgi:hypothetical protein
MRPLRFWVSVILVFCMALGYLFFSAPEPLAAVDAADNSFSTEEAMALLAYENDVTRTLYTKAIVGAGKAQGWMFSEDWADPDVVAGPLPALFLRGIAEELNSGEVPLGLYLGSDFPIESSNQFQGRQAEIFTEMRERLEPAYFFDQVTHETIGMFPDFASAPACVTCHNEHERTSKTDWELGDLMGATTWSFPGDSVTTDEVVSMLQAYRQGVANVWSRYLLEIEDMDASMRPEIGSSWPSQGAYIPSGRAFQDSVAELASPHLLAAILEAHE